MEFYQHWNITLQGILLIVNIIVLLLILKYVRDTTKIAKSTEKHNAIISRPYVVAHIANKSDFQPISILVRNYTAIHASVTILIVPHVKDSILPKGSGNIIISAPRQLGPFNGKNVWNVSAMDSIEVSTSFKSISDKLTENNDEILLDILVKVAEFGQTNYVENPPIQYRWKCPDGPWTYNPLPEKYGPEQT